MRRSIPALFLLLGLAAGCSSAGEPEKGASPDENVRFEGASAISESDLRDLIGRDVKRFRADPRLTALHDAAYRIEYPYRPEGFDRVRVTPRVEGDQVIFRIEEGPRVYLGDVRFENSSVFRTEELRQIVPGRFLGEATPYSLRLVLQIEDGVIASYRERGFIDATVTRKVRPDNDDRMNLEFVIDEGKPYVVAEIRNLPLEKGLQENTSVALGRPFKPGT